MIFGGSLVAILARFRDFMRSPERKVLAAFILFAAIIYVPFMLRGGFEYDDWSAAGLSKGCPGIISSYKCFWPNYPDRPLASAYYSINSNLFHMWSPGYIMLAVCMWLVGVWLIYQVFRRRFGLSFAVPFLFLAAIPSISSSVIFSPAMQSIGAAAFLLWAGSFYLLDKYLLGARSRYLSASFGLMFASLMLYESSLPLFALSACWPHIVRASRRKISRDEWLRYFKTFLAPLLSILIVVIAYQKLFVLHYYPAISKVRFGKSNHLFNFGIRVLTNDIYNLTIGLANFCARGVFRLKSSGPALQLSVLVLAVVMAWGIRQTFSYKNTIKPRVYPGLWLAILTGVLLIGLLHFIAVSPPTFVGYLNRGLASGSIILALVGSIVWTRVFCRTNTMMLIGILVFASYITTFVLQRSNYDNANQQRLTIQSEVLPQIKAHYQPKMFVLANVPEYTQKNFDNETIYSDEVFDWGNSLGDLSGSRSVRGISLSPGRLNRGELVVRNDGLEVMHDTKNIVPISSIWYYNVNSQKLIKIGSESQLKTLFSNELKYAAGYPLAVDVPFRNNLRDWLAPDY